ncbi:RHS repeat-associated core domain-containing protein, partial [Fangia hongkongensis]
RSYDTKLNRFISQDTYALFNRYASFNGDPLDNLDPLGHKSHKRRIIFNTIASGLGSAVTGLVVGLILPTHGWPGAFFGGLSGAISGSLISMAATGFIAKQDHKTFARAWNWRSFAANILSAIVLDGITGSVQTWSGGAPVEDTFSKSSVSYEALSSTFVKHSLDNGQTSFDRDYFESEMRKIAQQTKFSAQERQSYKNTLSKLDAQLFELQEYYNNDTASKLTSAQFHSNYAEFKAAARVYQQNLHNMAYLTFTNAGGGLGNIADLYNARVIAENVGCTKSLKDVNAASLISKYFEYQYWMLKLSRAA